MATTNRTIRIDDELWERLQGIAGANDWSVSDVIRNMLWRRVPRETPCFNCTDPADVWRSVEISSDLSKERIPDLETLLQYVKTDTPLPKDHSPVELAFYACHECGVGVESSLLEVQGGYTAHSLALTKNADLLYEHHMDRRAHGSLKERTWTDKAEQAGAHMREIVKKWGA